MYIPRPSQASVCWCCKYQGVGAASTRGLVLQVPGGWCCKYQGVGAARTRGLVLQVPGGWCCKYQGVGAARTRGLVLQVPGGWCCKYQGVGAARTRGLVLQVPGGEGAWVRDCPTISHGVWFVCEVEVPDNHDHLVLILQTSQNGLLFFM